MDEIEAGKAPTLPLPLLLGVTAISACMMFLALRRTGSLQGAFLIIAIWLRVMTGAFHTVTFAPLIGGLSINALISVATVFVGVTVISLRTFSRVWVMPIYMLMMVIAISGLINQMPSGFIDVFFKWAFALVVISAMYEAMMKAGADRILGLVMYCYTPIFIFQILSMALGLGKQTEGADALSYIGGYNHEAAFSVMIVGFVTVVFLNNKMAFSVKITLILLGVFSIMVANYRTAIIAVLPLLAGTFILEGVSRFDRKSRTFVTILVIPIAITIVVLGADALAQRFADLGTLLADGGRFLKPPNEFTDDERKILSGRLYIWSSYITGYLRGTDMQILFGFGPNSWIGIFAKYAHNTLVSYLYEFGLTGAAALLMIWGVFLAGAFKVSDPLIRIKLLLSQISFLLLNQATMPHWNIEGNIVFASIQGCLLLHLSPLARYQHNTTLSEEPHPKVLGRIKARKLDIDVKALR